MNGLYVSPFWVGFFVGLLSALALFIILIIICVKYDSKKKK